MTSLDHEREAITGIRECVNQFESKLKLLAEETTVLNNAVHKAYRDEDYSLRECELIEDITKRNKIQSTALKQETKVVKAILDDITEALAKECDGPDGGSKELKRRYSIGLRIAHQRITLGGGELHWRVIGVRNALQELRRTLAPEKAELESEKELLEKGALRYPAPTINPPEERTTYSQVIEKAYNSVAISADLCDVCTKLDEAVLKGIKIFDEYGPAPPVLK